ncbi:MAG: SurA N-terminal domain-containing protein [Planctomycetes bacterium]|nr:SurA N-terminal domain-containing protein [Planctomycetota bacterium]
MRIKYVFGAKCSMFLAMFFLVYAPARDVSSKEDKSPKIVARVERQNITKEEIAVHKSTVDAAIRNQEGDPGDKTRAQIQHQLEKQRLAAQIKHIVLRKAMEEHGINAKRSEIEREIEKIRPRLVKSPEKALQREQKLLLQLAKAIESVGTKDDIDRKVYNKYLKGLIPVETWAALLASKKTLKKRKEYAKKIRRGIPHDVRDLYRDMWASARSRVLMRKLKNKVTEGELEVTESEVSERLAKWEKTHSVSVSRRKLKDRIRDQLGQEKREEAFVQWLQERYRQTEIEICAPKYKSVKALLDVRGKTKANKSRRK